MQLFYILQNIGYTFYLLFLFFRCAVAAWYAYIGGHFAFGKGGRATAARPSQGYVIQIHSNKPFTELSVTYVHFNRIIPTNFCFTVRQVGLG